MVVQSHRRPLLALLVLIAVFFTACTSRKSKPIDTKVLSAFSDFVLVGTAPYDGKGPLDKMDPHGSSPLPLPTQLEVGKLYIFHHRRPLDGEKLAIVELPSRLRKLGIEITQAPKSRRDLMLPYLGGPVFTIRFRDGGHSGLITSRLSPNLTKNIHAAWPGSNRTFPGLR